MKRNIYIAVIAGGLAAIAIYVFFHGNCRLIDTKQPEIKKHADETQYGYEAVRKEATLESPHANINLDMKFQEEGSSTSQMPESDEKTEEEFMQEETDIDGDVAVDPDIAKKMEQQIMQTQAQYTPPKPVFEVIEQEIQNIEKKKKAMQEEIIKKMGIPGLRHIPNNKE